MELFHLFDYSIDFFLTFILVVFIFVLYITGWCREKSGAEKVVYFPCPSREVYLNLYDPTNYLSNVTIKDEVGNNCANTYIFDEYN